MSCAALFWSFASSSRRVNRCCQTNTHVLEMLSFYTHKCKYVLCVINILLYQHLHVFLLEWSCQVRAIIVSEPLAVYIYIYKDTGAGDWSCIVSRFLPRVVHLSRRHSGGYESNFSSDLRIPCLVQCREAFEALRCPSEPAETKAVNRARVHSDRKQGRRSLTPAQSGSELPHLVFSLDGWKQVFPFQLLLLSFYRSCFDWLVMNQSNLQL